MAFCTHCGTAVGDRDAFCGSCGTRQAGSGPGPGAPAAAPPRLATDSISPRTAATLCYVPWLGWIMSIVVLASERYRQEANARFHAFQGLYLFVAYLIVDRVLRPLFWGNFGGVNPTGLLKIALIVGWIYLLVKTSQGETVRLPVVGDLAEKSAAEQG